MASDAVRLQSVTGASSGIRYELARQCPEHCFDLLVVADEPAIHDAAADFRALGTSVDSVEADLATIEGVDKLYAAARGRPVEALLANAGRGRGKAFLDQDFDDVRHVVDQNYRHETGFEAMMKGEGDVVTSWHNKLRTAIASVTPAGALAEQHRKIAEPGSATN